MDQEEIMKIANAALELGFQDELKEAASKCKSKPKKAAIEKKASATKVEFPKMSWSEIDSWIKHRFSVPATVGVEKAASELTELDKLSHLIDGELGN